MDALAMLWVIARTAHLLAIRRMTPVEVESDQEEGWRMTPVEVGSDQEEGCETDQDIPLMYTQKVEMLGNGCATGT